MALTDPLTEEDSCSVHENGSMFDENDLLDSSAVDTGPDQQLTISGAAVVTGIDNTGVLSQHKRKRRLHSYEVNPSIRKRQQIRLLRKLCSLMEEYIARVGQQAVLVCCTPGTVQPHVYRVFGSQPLESVIRSHKSSIISDLEVALTNETSPHNDDSSPMFDLPALVADGLPVSLNKMTQAQLRCFIPEMLRFSTGKSKPGWGKPECRPVWWPEEVPWANVRSDVRDEETKKVNSWTHALRRVIFNCYRYHGREDLLPDYHQLSEDQLHEMAVQIQPDQFGQTLLKAISGADGSMLIEIDTGDSSNHSSQFIQLSDGSHARILHELPGGMKSGEHGKLLYLTQDSSHLLTDESQQLVLANCNDSLSMITLPASFYQSFMTTEYSQGAESTVEDNYQIISLTGQDDVQSDVSIKLEKNHSAHLC